MVGRRSKPWVEGRGTPDEVKPQVSGELFYGGHKAGDQRVRQRNRAAVVRVHEPVMDLLNEVMLAEGVSGKRLESALGLGADRVRDMRRFDSAWDVMKVARQCLWAMGYDLEVRVRKVQQPQREVVMTKEDLEMRKVRRVKGTRNPEWAKDKMWNYLGMDKLPQK